MFENKRTFFVIFCCNNFSILLDENNQKTIVVWIIQGSEANTRVFRNNNRIDRHILSDAMPYLISVRIDKK